MRVFTSNFFVSVVRNGSACSISFNFALTLPAVSLICLLQFSKGSKCTPRYLYVSVLFSISPVIFSSKLESFLSFLFLPFASFCFQISFILICQHLGLAYLFLTSWRFGQARCLIYFVMHQSVDHDVPEWCHQHTDESYNDSRDNVIYVQ